MALVNKSRLGLPGFLRRPQETAPPDPQPQPHVHPHAPRSSFWTNAGATADRTVEAFAMAVLETPGLRRVAARTLGPKVEFLVTVDGTWHEAVEAIEPRIRPLLLTGAPFEYRVIQTDWGEADPPGFLGIVEFEDAVAASR